MRSKRIISLVVVFVLFCSLFGQASIIYANETNSPSTNYDVEDYVYVDLTASANNVVYSVMNQGIYFKTNNELAAVVPQYHDKINLISKWEYHNE